MDTYRHIIWYINAFVYKLPKEFMMMVLIFLKTICTKDKFGNTSIVFLLPFYYSTACVFLIEATYFETI